MVGGERSVRSARTRRSHAHAAGSQMPSRMALAALLLCGAGVATEASGRGLRAAARGAVLSPGQGPGPCPSAPGDLPEPFAKAMARRPFDLGLARAAWYAAVAAGTGSAAEQPALCVATAPRGPVEHYEVKHVGDAELHGGDAARIVVATARLQQRGSPPQRYIVVAVPAPTSRRRGDARRTGGRSMSGMLGPCSVGNRCGRSSAAPPLPR